MQYTFEEYFNLINEGFVVKDNIVYFNPESKDVINTTFGKFKDKQPYKKKLEFGTLYSPYIANKTDEYTEILKAIKGQSKKYNIDSASYTKFIKRTALYLSKLITDNHIDTILMLESSSKILNDLLTELRLYLPKYYETFSYDKGIFKNPDLSQITIEYSGFEFKDETVKNLQQTINRQQKNNYFSIKKFNTKDRKFIKNWLILKNNLLSKIIDKRVALIDDIVTSGATMDEASRLLNEAGAKEVIGFAIVKSN